MCDRLKMLSMNPKKKVLPKKVIIVDDEKIQ